ncbi:MAG: hypothetical protein WA421_19740 [Nitrososphaeraceae archaeon]
MPMPPQFANKRNAIKKVSKFGRPSKPKKANLKPIGPSNNTVLQAIGKVGGASQKVPPFSGGGF